MKKQKSQSSSDDTQDESALWATMVVNIISLLVTAIMGMQKKGKSSLSNMDASQSNIHLQAVLTQLNNMSQASCTCDNKQSKKARFGAEESITTPPDSLLDSIVRTIGSNGGWHEDIVTTNPFEENENVLNEGFVTLPEEVQTDITHEQGHFKYMSEQELNEDAVVLTTGSIGMEEFTQVSDMSLGVVAIQTSIDTTHVSTETSPADVMDKEIQNKPSTCCICIQSSISSDELDSPQRFISSTDTVNCYPTTNTEFQYEVDSLDVALEQELCSCDSVNVQTTTPSQMSEEPIYRPYNTKSLDINKFRYCKLDAQYRERLEKQPVCPITCPQYIRACPGVAMRGRLYPPEMISPVPPRQIPPHLNMRHKVRLRAEGPPPPFTPPDVTLVSRRIKSSPVYSTGPSLPNRTASKSCFGKPCNSKHASTSNKSHSSTQSSRTSSIPISNSNTRPKVNTSTSNTSGDCSCQPKCSYKKS